MSNIEQAFYTADEISKYLGINKATFYRYVNAGKISKGIKLSERRTVWRKKYLDEFLDRLEQEQTAEE